MRTNTQQTIAAILALAMAFTFNACSSDDNGDGGGGSSSLESLLANDPWYQQMKKELEYYDPYNSRERCTAAGVVERKCGDKLWYNPLRQYCIDDDDDDDDVYEVGTFEVCGSDVYTKFPSGNGEDKCENNVLLSRCEDSEDLWYNEKTQECNREYSNGQPSYSIVPIDPKNLCNGVRFNYDEGDRECRDGVVKRSCGDLWYNRDTEYCDRNDGNKVKPLPKCNGMYMDGHELEYGDERCAADGKTLERKCDFQDDEEATWYNPITQACSYNGGSYTLKNKIKCSK